MGDTTMKIKVQKYGGSSVADQNKLKHVARRIVEARHPGYGIVVVVSAMGDTTEELLQVAQGLSKAPDRRELDMLLSSGERISTALLTLAIQNMGQDAISLTGAQSGIVTCDRHFNAEIDHVDPQRILEELEQGKIVVVAGFQGASPEGETTTLGRGGSDTTAVALAAALEAERCEIFSDVDGVFTADPRIVEEARPLEVIDYEEMLELARHGAGVLKTDAVQHARDLGVVLRAASTFSEAPGTIVTDLGDERGQELEVRGVACHRELIRVAMEPCEELHKKVLAAGGSPEVYLDGPYRNGTSDERHEVLVKPENVADAAVLQEALFEQFGSRVEVETGIGSVSVIGWGLGNAEEPRRSFEQLGAQVGSANGRHVASDHSLTYLLESELVESTARTLHGKLVTSSLAAAKASAEGRLDEQWKGRPSA
jgi:aspartate kinase